MLNTRTPLQCVVTCLLGVTSRSWPANCGLFVLLDSSDSDLTDSYIFSCVVLVCSVVSAGLLFL